MRSRVMPGSSVTIERRVPVRRLKSVDLPTFGRPTITMDGSLAVIEIPAGFLAQNGNLHCSAPSDGAREYSRTAPHAEAGSSHLEQAAEDSVAQPGAPP